ncbi:hypothetical protein Pelo_5588 [Pelomyxa schiedti]|nr:hypothetical protein Pelo_5588 [Pelomyxa schiedti]
MKSSLRFPPTEAHLHPQTMHAFALTRVPQSNSSSNWQALDFPFFYPKDSCISQFFFFFPYLRRSRTMATTPEPKLFHKWTYGDVVVNDISLVDYIALKQKDNASAKHSAQSPSDS